MNSKYTHAVALLLLTALAGACETNRGITPVRTAFNRGAYHFSHRRYDAAIHEYRRAIETNPDDMRARFNLGVALETKAQQTNGKERQRLRGRAERVYRAMLERAPEHLRGNINLAALEYESGQRDAALARLRRMLEAHPNRAMPRTALAAHLMRQEQFEEARKSLETARQLEPASARVNTLLGELHARRGALASSAAAYRRALKTDPADLAALLALAQVQTRRDQPDKALAALRRVLLIDPDHWTAHLRTARLLEDRGDLAAAAHHLQRARELDHQRAGDHPRPDYARRLRKLYATLADRTLPRTAEQPAKP